MEGGDINISRMKGKIVDYDDDDDSDEDEIVIKQPRNPDANQPQIKTSNIETHSHISELIKEMINNIDPEKIENSQISAISVSESASPSSSTSA